MSLQPPGDMLDAPQQNNTLSVNVLAHKTAFVEAFRNCGSTNKTSTPDQQDGENQIQASPLADEVPENTSVPDVAQESEITKPTFSGGRWIFPATSAQSIENSVDEDIGDSTSGAGEEVLRYIRVWICKYFRQC